MADLINARHVPLGLNFELQDALSVSRNLGLATRDVATAQKRAIGTLRRRLPVQARRDIQAEYALKAGRVAQDLSVRDGGGGLKLRGYFRGVGLRNYGARDLRKSGGGVSYSVLRGKRAIRPHSFFAPLSGGNVQVVHRQGEKRRMTRGRYVGKMRQPIVVDYGASVAQMLAKGRRPERLADFARGVLRAEIQRLLQYAGT